MVSGVRNRVERKLAAILAADIAGYSRLMGADEEGTLARLKAHRRELIDPKIAQHQGRIVKTTGDGMLAEFPSVVEAVQCAVEVQQAMFARNRDLQPDKRIVFRVGINLGDIIVDEGDVYGEGVNVAARLEALAEPGEVCVSQAVHDQVRDRLPSLTFEDRGEHSVKNIARPVRVFGVNFDNYAAPIAAPMAAVRLPSRALRAGIVAAGVALVVVCAGLWWQLGRTPPPARIGVTAPPGTSNSAAPAEASAPRLSIVVLPFANLSNDPEQDYFADGLTEDLTTDLSRISGSFVISRNTAFTYKGKPTDAKQVSRELGVRYVLEGSVRRSANQVRVNAQLIDGETGAHLWADRFDYQRGDLFQMQNEITARIARTLSLELVEAEGHRALRQRPNNPNAMDLVMRGTAIMNRTRQGDDLSEARRLFQETIRLDANMAPAWEGLAGTFLFNSRFSPSREEDLRQAGEAIERALTLDPKSALAHHMKATLHYQFGRLEQAVTEYETAISLDRNFANSYGMLGATKVILGQPQEAFEHVQKAIQISPRDSSLSVWQLFVGVANLHLGRDDEAVVWLRKSVDLNPRSSFGHLFLASALALAGQEAAARVEMAEFQRLNPGFTLGRFKAVEPSDRPAFVAQRQRVYEGLRQAGMPE
ncbi:adenylate/guanylate cyclase domain-containing protein [Bradyrhizobium hipponense]|uniref:Adenylate/guanylate cyclase domain-containing protein n=1 Tax=Bradyrhizobium hipponense TaxID=2605638 RepID=A0A5S4YKW5_9BRAD|nr:adenylate/guanylate cyclase domain-containing protein [Bradyrhizobium hipponense]TYO65040.1 adenylate/guanylate cyclase domain-containing protein [Bradyrhizobium hipponense]